MRGYMPSDYEEVFERLEKEFNWDALFGKNSTALEGVKRFIEAELKREGEEMYEFAIEEASQLGEGMKKTTDKKQIRIYTDEGIIGDLRDMNAPYNQALSDYQRALKSLIE